MSKKKTKQKHRHVQKKPQLDKAYQVTEEKKVYEFKANEKLFEGKVKADENPVLKEAAVDKVKAGGKKLKAEALRNNGFISDADARKHNGRNAEADAGKYDRWIAESDADRYKEWIAEADELNSRIQEADALGNNGSIVQSVVRSSDTVALKTDGLSENGVALSGGSSAIRPGIRSVHTLYGRSDLTKAEKKKLQYYERVKEARAKLKREQSFEYRFADGSETGGTSITSETPGNEAVFHPDSAIKGGIIRTSRLGKYEVRQKILEDSDDNSAVQAAATAEHTADDTYHFVDGMVKHGQKSHYSKAARLESKEMNGSAESAFYENLREHPKGGAGSAFCENHREHPEAKSKHRQKDLQKTKIKREYAMAWKHSKDKEMAADSATKARDTGAAVARKIQEFIARHKVLFLIICGVGVIFIAILSTFSSFGTALTESMSSIMAGSYLSEPEEIDAADLSFTEREAKLQQQIDGIEEEYPDYDVYEYNLDEIGHNPATLIGYLSTRYTEFTAAGVDDELQELFEAMYTLTVTPTTGTRYRDVTDEEGNVLYDEETGEALQEEYEASILQVRLERKPLETVVSGRLDNEQQEVFRGLYETRGLLQNFASPLALYWYNYVSSYYGYRTDPEDGSLKLHKGIDIAVPEGTDVYSGQDGTVTYTGYDEDGFGNYIVIENADAYMSKYAHLNSILVNAGQEVSRGTLIGKSGNTGASTGSHLHLECLYRGEYYNPLFYFEAGDGTLYGEDIDRAAVPENPSGIMPPAAYDDESAANLISYAEQFLGMPYVWGGSSPSTGFDCSGFVCYVYTHSGTYNLPRTTASAIYSKCEVISASEARPGDLIFFTKTYNSPKPVTHVGIYCGNGTMLHCGDPIKYASINTAYWQQHFYAFGRLSGT